MFYLLERIQGGSLDDFRLDSKTASQLTVSHFLYAGDTIIFCGADPDQFSYLRSILLCFHAVSRLQVNLSKSKLILVGEVTQVDYLETILECKVCTLPVS